MAGRLLADLGAEVRPCRSRRPATRCAPSRTAARRGTRASSPVVVAGPDDPALAALLAAADIVIDTPGFAGRVDARSRARARRGLGERHAVRARRPARRSGGRPTSA